MFNNNCYKAQSAIEYLVTYGWMLVIVAIVSGFIFNFVSTECKLEISDASGSTISIQDEAITSDNQLKLVFRSISENEVQIREVSIEDNNNSILQSDDIRIMPGSSEVYELAEVEEKETKCTDAKLEVNFDEGPLTNQVTTFDVQLPVSLIQAVEKLLDIEGGEIDKIIIESQLSPETGSKICIGNKCQNQDIQESDQGVNRSGDSLKGPLIASEISVDCIGSACYSGDFQEGSLNGTVSNINNTMDGTLELDELRPLNEELVIYN